MGGGVATSTIDLDSDGYFDLCKKNQNHCNQNVFWSQYGKNALAACSAPQTPSWILGRKDGKNVGKEGEGKRDKKEGRRIGGKEEEGTLLISFAPPAPTSEPWRRHCTQS